MPAKKSSVAEFLVWLKNNEPYLFGVVAEKAATLRDDEMGITFDFSALVDTVSDSASKIGDTLLKAGTAYLGYKQSKDLIALQKAKLAAQNAALAKQAAEQQAVIERQMAQDKAAQIAAQKEVMARYKLAMQGRSQPPSNYRTIVTGDVQSTTNAVSQIINRPWYTDPAIIVPAAVAGVTLLVIAKRR